MKSSFPQHDKLAEIMCCLLDWLLELCALATSKIISGRVPTCVSTHSWQFYNAAPLGNQATSTPT